MSDSFHDRQSQRNYNGNVKRKTQPTVDKALLSDDENNSDVLQPDNGTINTNSMSHFGYASETDDELTTTVSESASKLSSFHDLKPFLSKKILQEKRSDVPHSSKSEKIRTTELDYLQKDTAGMDSNTSLYEFKPDQEEIRSLSALNFNASCSSLNLHRNKLLKLASLHRMHSQMYVKRSSNLLTRASNVRLNDSRHRCAVIKSKTDSADSDWINVCRICHGGVSIGDLLSPCGCRGSIAKTHMECLERWLKESSSSHCELCKHHFHIIRQPKYGILQSIFVFLRHPGDHLREILLDLCGFVIYTPATIGSTYMLMLLCESISKSSLQQTRNPTFHIMTLAAVLGMAAIDFTYSSWLAANCQKHLVAWRNWYRTNCDVKVILPNEAGGGCVAAEKQSRLMFSTTLDEELD